MFCFRCHLKQNSSFKLFQLFSEFGILVLSIVDQNDCLSLLLLEQLQQPIDIFLPINIHSLPYFFSQFLVFFQLYLTCLCFFLQFLRLIFQISRPQFS
ncbi:hypothetical protein EVA_13189 [gut metagenome]|uniref:Uncharacterized protein n=1 Tax=gut metagenome TaxID=749906 RepID=J9FW00_9ZZZZ